MAGRPHTPTVLLELSGALRHDRKRYRARANEPKPVGPLGGYPDHWSQPSSYLRGSREELWDHFVAIAPPGLLTVSDGPQLELLVIATLEARRPGKQQLRYMEAASKYMRLLGLNPSDRARMGITAQATGEQRSKLEQFTQRKRA